MRSEMDGDDSMSKLRADTPLCRTSAGHLSSSAFPTIISDHCHCTAMLPCSHSLTSNLAYEKYCPPELQSQETSRLLYGGSTS